MDLLLFRHNEFSQNGEDGILRKLLSVIGEESRASCEFGAWDGCHFSNCRHLVLEGWRCLMIEGDVDRYRQLCRTYAGHPKVVPIHAFVDTQENSIDKILERARFPLLDVLSIDIDGLDYEILANLEARPRIICIEVNAGHSPDNTILLPRSVALRNVGQPLGSFCVLAERMGYGLMCYNGNAFFVRNDCMQRAGWVSLTATEAYRRFLAAATREELEWLMMVNEGLVPPFYAYRNQYLTRDRLEISVARANALRAKAAVYRVVRSAKRTIQYRR
jgi:hypothetical protein